MIRFLALVAIVLRQAWAADASPAVVGRNVRTSIEGTGDAAFDMLVIHFDATVRNGTASEIRIAAKPVFVPGVDRRSETGEWKTWQTLSSYDVGKDSDDKYEPCSVVPSQKTFDLSQVGTQIFLKRDGTKTPLVLRFHLLVRCKDGSARPSLSLTTDPVEIPVPETSSGSEDGCRSERVLTSFLDPHVSVSRFASGGRLHLHLPAPF